jgi:putative nucleotidyltransferase with HDIG domain
MLILTDRAKDGLAIHDYLTRRGCCHVVDLHQAPAQSSKHPIIVCDADVGNETSVRLLGAALTKHRIDAGIPVLFLTRDNSNLTASLALSLGATELIHSGSSPALILAVAERLIDTYQGKSKGGTRPASTTEALAFDVKSGLASCFDAVKRREPVSIAELNKGADILLSAIKKTKIRVWLDVVRRFDDVTYQHCLLVAGLVAVLSLKLGLTPKHQHLLSQAALIHDVGKACVPASILNKPSALSKSEMDVMRTHAALGYDMLVRQGSISPVILDIVRHHHEYLDGTGYPDRLRGAQISGYVRIVTICDIYAALIERRPYKAPMQPQLALAMLIGMGVKLDGELLKSFEAVIADTG